MSKKLIISSNNEKKIKEIKDILSNLQIEIRSLRDEGIDIDVVEDGDTFEANAKKKAVEIKDYLLNRGESNFIVLADDSGLEVDALGGAPGVYSARYAGEHGNDEENNKKLLRELENVSDENRGAQFVCQLALVDDTGRYVTIRGEVRGTILRKLNGSGGFGYDPLFFYKPFNKTFGEATKEEKNSISHRGIALEKMRKSILEFI